jgi:SPP1 family predicted phage head-tail adaptor
MRSGLLQQRLLLQRPVRSRNSLNEDEITWTDVAMVWGAVNPNAGRNYFEALQANAEVQGMVRLRYRSDIDPTWRLVHEGRTLEIEYIADPQERHKELLVYYKESQD